ncbi:MAG: lysophospholipid acyltransferase family protein [Betaproteobacteria bacterium]|nr:lysophospholipid acyltransferase family protein [Betaproteobacteria bacterium]MDH5222172.1 lysophospholipid acyltransferase family protein [Betaproteobacteria bacterium]MDH5350937.1 lysophospholipid acyltransferase family protein [Betaproteobacteria bacterium]
MMQLLARLPLAFVHALGVAVAWVIYAFAAKWRARLRANLAQAGYGDARHRRAAVAEAGKMVFEAPRMWLRPGAELRALIRRVEGMEAVLAARAAGKGIVFFTPHYGCFEITPLVASGHMPLTVLYRPHKKERLQRVIVEGRERKNIALAPASTAGVRMLLAALRRGEAIGILPDQVPGRGEGEWVEFFGRPAYTMTLAGKFAAREDCAAFLAMCERLPRGAGYAVRILPLAPALPGESPARRINRALEEAIRERPEQYMWSYNRYKRPHGAPPPP